MAQPLYTDVIAQATLTATLTHLFTVPAGQRWVILDGWLSFLSGGSVTLLDPATFLPFYTGNLAGAAGVVHVTSHTVLDQGMNVSANLAGSFGSVYLSGWKLTIV